MYQLRGEGAKAMSDLTAIVDTEDAPVKLRVNALVKRGSLHMQHERVEDSLRDFDRAAVLDPSNCDVFHHRGQVVLRLAIFWCFV